MNQPLSNAAGQPTATAIRPPKKLKITVEGGKPSDRKEVLAALQRFKEWRGTKITLVEGAINLVHHGVGEGDQTLPKEEPWDWTDGEWKARLYGRYRVAEQEHNFLVELCAAIADGDREIQYIQSWTDIELSIFEAGVFLNKRLAELRRGDEKFLVEISRVPVNFQGNLQITVHHQPKKGDLDA
jgi:hypothetical protein